MNKVFKYSGRDNLDVMSFAKNYNASIFNWLSKDLKSNSVILDFGSGKGEFFNRFGKNIYAIEPDVDMHINFPDNYIFSSIEQIQHKFDLIYSVNVLEHIKDDSLIIEQFKTLLANNESIVKIFVPARQELYSSMDAKVGHYRRYSKKQIEKLFLEAGYEVKSCYYFDFLGYFAAAIYKILGKSGDINPKSLMFYDKYIFPLSLFLDKFFCRYLGKNIVIEAMLKK